MEFVNLQRKSRVKVSSQRGTPDLIGVEGSIFIWCGRGKLGRHDPSFGPRHYSVKLHLTKQLARTPETAPIVLIHLLYNQGTMSPTDYPILPFESKMKWADWLARHHDKSSGVWLKLAKKDSGIPSVTYDEALDVTLCYGWIDGQKKGFDQ